MIIIKLKPEDYRFKDEIVTILLDKISELKNIEFSVEYTEHFTSIQHPGGSRLARKIFNILPLELNKLKMKDIIEVIDETSLYD